MAVIDRSRNGNADENQIDGGAGHGGIDDGIGNDIIEVRRRLGGFAIRQTPGPETVG